LIDPSTENPWDFLTYDPDMGNIEAAFDASQNCESEKGLQTVAILGLNRRERLVNVYQKTYQRLVETVQSSSQSSDTDLVNQLINADDHGLLGWCFSPQGKRQAPFDRLTHSHFEIWKQRTA
jgi:hypothetical protein